MNRITAIATSAVFQPLGMIGKVGPQAEEAEEAEEAVTVDNSRAALEARLEKALAEPDYEREETFQYLKEYQKRKRLEQRLAREDEASEKARAALERILREDAERSVQETEGTMSEEAMMESAGVGYLEDEDGKLTKRRTAVLRRTPARRKTHTRRRTAAAVKDKNGDPLRRQFTEADCERVNKNRCRYTRAAWLKQMLAIAEGRLTVTKEQFQAFRDYGRSRGWTSASTKLEIARVKAAIPLFLI